MRTPGVTAVQIWATVTGEGIGNLARRRRCEPLRGAGRRESGGVHLNVRLQGRLRREACQGGLRLSEGELWTTLRSALLAARGRAGRPRPSGDAGRQYLEGLVRIASGSRGRRDRRQIRQFTAGQRERRLLIADTLGRGGQAGRRRGVRQRGGVRNHEGGRSVDRRVLGSVPPGRHAPIVTAPEGQPAVSCPAIEGRTRAGRRRPARPGRVEPLGWMDRLRGHRRERSGVEESCRLARCATTTPRRASGSCPRTRAERTCTSASALPDGVTTLKRGQKVGIRRGGR